jgi:hypothetical protein
LLEVLHISQCEPDILSQVHDLLEQKGSRTDFLLLKKIAVEFVKVSDDRNSRVPLEFWIGLGAVKEKLIVDGRGIEVETGIRVVEENFSGRVEMSRSWYVVKLPYTTATCNLTTRDPA